VEKRYEEHLLQKKSLPMKNLLIFPLILLLSGCQQTKQTDMKEQDNATEQALPSPEISNETKDKQGGKPGNAPEDNIFQFVQQKETPKIDSLLIKKAVIRFQVEDLSKSNAIIRQSVRQAGGYLLSSSETRNNNEQSTHFTVRIPNTRFEKLVDELVKNSVFLNDKTISAEDVTEEFVDIFVRIKAKKEVEQRYLDILRSAKTVEDILKVEEQLRIIREEIEAKQGRLKFLKDQVQYSTIDLNIYQVIPYTAEPQIGFFSRLGQAFGQGWESLQGFIVGLASLWWFWILLAGLIYALRRWWKGRKRLVV
jgi:polyhydroxyalkanoate synthesis regulator phasin